MRKLGQLRVTYELLGEALGLDGDHKIVAIGQTPYDPLYQTVTFLVEGRSCPECHEGVVPPLIRNEVTTRWWNNMKQDREN